MREEMLSNPIQRANPLNDPKFKEIQGYNNYDLTNMQAISPRFGEVTPNTVFETVPGDRHMLHGNCKTVLNQIDANLFSQVNEYMDYFYVPMRCVFPINYEKIVPNPTKGVDLPWKALPQIPLLAFLKNFVDGVHTVRILDAPDSYVFDSSVSDAITVALDPEADEPTVFSFALNQFLYLATVISRGQLLDYLGYSLDLPLSQEGFSDDGLYRPYVSVLQQKIDALFDSLLSDGTTSFTPALRGFDFSDSPIGFRNNEYVIERSPRPFYLKVKYIPAPGQWRLDSFRASLYDCFERGLFIDIALTEDHIPVVRKAMQEVYDALFSLGRFYIPDESTAEPFSDGGFINPLRVASYQLSVAEYMTNDSVDNVYTAELYMQNLRSIMFPSSGGVSQEPTFDYNGVDTEFDLLTTGAFEKAFFDELFDGAPLRSQVFASVFLMLRRSLRYGDYFSTGRPNLLAVGQLGIPVNTQGQVSPIDVTKNLVMQRFLNAVNWVGSRFVNYVTALFGVKPSDTGCHPTFIAHRKVALEIDTVTNTAGDQGRQSTNLIGTTDSNAIDVFIDDFGCIIGVTSFDVLPMYPSGIDRNFTNSDRYSMFNSMLQNVGDQEIQLSEISGIPKTNSTVFAYMVRYAQYKFGVSRAHGAFVNSLPGFVMKYPWQSLVDSGDGSVRISPDFIRDKPYFFDQFFAQRTGLSPAAYYHFQVPVTNQHSAARKMQYQPPVLF